MSHITTLTLQVTCLDSFALACQQRGVELKRDQHTFRNFAGQRTKCDMAVVDPTNKEAYEIGLIRSPDGKSYAVQMDNWDGGKGLNAKVGENAGLLMQSYGINAARRQAQKQGMAVFEERLPDGSVRLKCEPRQQLAQAGAGAWQGSGY